MWVLSGRGHAQCLRTRATPRVGRVSVVSSRTIVVFLHRSIPRRPAPVPLQSDVTALPERGSLAPGKPLDNPSTWITARPWTTWSRPSSTWPPALPNGSLASTVSEQRHNCQTTAGGPCPSRSSHPRWKGPELPISARVDSTIASGGDPHASLLAGVELPIAGMSSQQRSGL